MIDRWVNNFTAVKSMNESRFWIFFTMIFDYHNLHRQGMLRSVAHPQSPLRWELLSVDVDYESTMLNTDGVNPIKVDVIEENDVETLTSGISKLSIPGEKENLKCEQCGATYNKPWTLRNHMKNKHNLEVKETHECNTCQKEFSTSAKLEKHKQSHERNFVCDLCDEVFMEKLLLTQHKKEHLVCKICSRSCENTYALTRHVRSHKV